MSAHLSEAVHALHAVPVNPTTEGCPICPDYLALVAAAVAAERDRWDTEHARTAEHIDLHAVKQIIDVTGCDGGQGVTAWHALQPLVGHIEREAIVKARAAEREAWVGKIEALADAWADDTGIEGYINLGEAEDRLRALIAEARS